MTYREWAPPAGLRGALACLWTRVVPAEGGPPALVLPDGCADLIWQRGRGAYVAGPDTRPAPTPLPAGTVLMGARFRPGAVGPALGVPLSEMRNLRVDLLDLRPDLAARLPDDLPDGTARRRVAAIAAGLVLARPPDRVLGRAIAVLAEPAARVEELSRALALSERQLRRRFHFAVGYGPRTLRRVLRFQRFLSALDGGVDFARLAIELGFSDQPHLTRETTRLAGMPPAALMRALVSARPADAG